MTDPFSIALVGFLSAIAGGVVQAWASRNFEREKFERQSRNDAYAAYLKGVGELSFAKDITSSDSALSRIAEARGRVALFGSPRVVAAMAKAFRYGSDLRSDAAWPVHAEMIAAMRADVGQFKGVAESRDLFELMYGDERK